MHLFSLGEVVIMYKFILGKVVIFLGLNSLYIITLGEIVNIRAFLMLCNLGELANVLSSRG